MPLDVKIKCGIIEIVQLKLKEESKQLFDVNFFIVIVSYLYYFIPILFSDRNKNSMNQYDISLQQFYFILILLSTLQQKTSKLYIEL